MILTLLLSYLNGCRIDFLFEGFRLNCIRTDDRKLHIRKNHKFKKWIIQKQNENKLHYFYHWGSIYLPMKVTTIFFFSICLSLNSSFLFSDQNVVSTSFHPQCSYISFFLKEKLISHFWSFKWQWEKNNRNIQLWLFFLYNKFLCHKDENTDSKQNNYKCETTNIIYPHRTKQVCISYRPKRVYFARVKRRRRRMRMEQNRFDRNLVF